MKRLRDLRTSAMKKCRNTYSGCSVPPGIFMRGRCAAHAAQPEAFPSAFPATPTSRARGRGERAALRPMRPHSPAMGFPARYRRTRMAARAHSAGAPIEQEVRGHAATPCKGRRVRERQAAIKWEPADKPGSVVSSHSSGPRVAAWFKRPTRERRGQRHSPPIRSCSRWGLPCHAALAPRAVRSYRTVSPSPRVPPPLYCRPLERRDLAVVRCAPDVKSAAVFQQ